MWQKLDGYIILDPSLRGRTKKEKSQGGKEGKKRK